MRVNAGATALEFGAGVLANIGTQTLGSNGDTITLTLTAYDNYLIRGWMEPSGATVNGNIRFNSDTGANYGNARTEAGTRSSSQGATAIPIFSTGLSGANGFIDFWCIINNDGATKRKFLSGMMVDSGGDIESWFSGAWYNTTDLISSISVFNTGAADYVSGSFISAWGWNNP